MFDPTCIAKAYVSIFFRFGVCVGFFFMFVFGVGVVLFCFFFYALAFEFAFTVHPNHAQSKGGVEIPVAAILSTLSMLVYLRFFLTLSQ